MPRQAREKSGSGIYHVMLRGINRQNIFEDEEDRKRFIETLGYYKTISNYNVYGYCIMDNHIHLLLGEKSETISQAIKRISSSYVYWYNQKYNRCGHLFQERFRSETVETDAYFLTVLRYIHQNPMKAGLAEDVSKYSWSSYSEYFGGTGLVDIEFTLGIFSEDRNRAVQLFREYNAEVNRDTCLEYNEKVTMTDQEVLSYLYKLGVVDSSELQRLEKTERDIIIRMLKGISGITVRQLSRTTGISKSVIYRIWRDK